MDNFFEQNVEMRLCRDIANSHKHYSINNPSQSIPPAEICEYAPNNGNLDTDTSLIILSDGNKYDAFSLAEKVLYMWENFISSYVKK